MKQKLQEFEHNLIDIHRQNKMAILFSCYGNKGNDDVWEK